MLHQWEPKAVAGATFVLIFIVTACAPHSSVRKVLFKGRGVSADIAGDRDLRAGPEKASKPYRVMGKKYYPLKTSKGFSQSGRASWYGPNFHGKLTANGEKYNQNASTAAHKTLPFNTLLKVENLENGNSTVVRINDRGPFVGTRIIDLSKKAAREINMIGSGTARVRITALSRRGLRSVTVEKRTPAQLPPAAKPTAPPEKADGGFWVQTGSFSEPQRAENYKTTVSGGAGNALISPKQHNGRLLYRVLLGPYDSYLEARGAADQLRFAKGVGAFVVVNP